MRNNLLEHFLKEKWSLSRFADSCSRNAGVVLFTEKNHFPSTNTNASAVLSGLVQADDVSTSQIIQGHNYSLITQQDINIILTVLVATGNQHK